MKKIFGFLLILVILLGVTGCGSSSSSGSSSSGKENRCGDTTDEHYAKTRSCNAKDNSYQNCSYSNCSCTCRPR